MLGNAGCEISHNISSNLHNPSHWHLNLADSYSQDKWRVMGFPARKAEIWVQSPAWRAEAQSPALSGSGGWHDPTCAEKAGTARYLSSRRTSFIFGLDPVFPNDDTIRFSWNFHYGLNKPGRVGWFSSFLERNPVHPSPWTTLAGLHFATWPPLPFGQMTTFQDSSSNDSTPNISFPFQVAVKPQTWTFPFRNLPRYNEEACWLNL